jgi:CRP-like cAMP-binding protein
MKTMDLMENTFAIEGRPQQLKSVKPKSPDFQKNNVPIVSNIPEIGLTSLMGKAKTVRYIRKDVLGLETNKPNTVLVIFSGEVRVISDDDRKHKEATFHVPESQSGFGKIALLTEELRSASNIILEKSVFAVILKRDFKNWLMNYPKLTFEISEK